MCIVPRTTYRGIGMITKDESHLVVGWGSDQVSVGEYWLSGDQLVGRVGAHNATNNRSLAWDGVLVEQAWNRRET